MSICVIPARGGSKRILRKNIRQFHGRPMISWSITAALKSGLFDRVVVSTDDEEICQIARAEGAEVPFMRPKNLANDYTTTMPVIAHAIDALSVSENDAVCCLYATAPFVQASDLAKGLKFLQLGARFTMSISRFDYPIQRALRRGPDGAVYMMDPTQMQVRSQDLEPAWHDAGQFYWGLASAWATDQIIFGAGAHGVAIPSNRVVDIDTLEDWARAEALFLVLHK